MSITNLVTAEVFRNLSDKQKQAIFSKLSDEECVDLYYSYEFWAREKQLFPPGNWWLWLLLSGRGFGKTFVGASWIIDQAIRAVGPALGIIAPTAADLRDICIEGPSGILARCHPNFRPKYSKSIGQLTFPNGVKVITFSAEDPESIRGFNGSGMWLDEFGVYKYPRETYDMAQMANRLGKNPQFVVTTTPKPLKIIKDWVLESRANPDKVKVVSGSTYENKSNLSASFIDQIAVYEGTSLGRQEIHGEVLDLEEAAIIRRSWFGMYESSKKLPFFQYIVQSYDTAFTEKTTNDKTACTTWGVYNDQQSGKTKVLLLDSWHDYLNYPDLRARAEKEYNASYGTDALRKPDIIIIEAKGSGISLYQDLNRIGLPCLSYNPGREDKVMRCHSITHILKGGLVQVLESDKRPGTFRSWAKPFLDEVCSFVEPGKEVEDDYVDSFTQAMRYLKDQGFLTIDDMLEEDDEYKKHIKKVNPYSA
jgi:phage terminase large subunit-like protein